MTDKYRGPGDPRYYDTDLGPVLKVRPDYIPGPQGAIISKTPAEPSTGERDTMFMAAVSALAEISVALGIPDDEAACANGNDLILERIAELHAAQAPSPVAPSEHICGICFNDPERCDIHDCGDMHERAAIPDEKAEQQPVAEVVECPTMGGQTLREIDGRWKFLAYGTKLYAAPIQPRQAEPISYTRPPEGERRGGGDVSSFVKTAWQAPSDALDAARYRWLRGAWLADPDAGEDVAWSCIMHSCDEDGMDADIDRAILSTQGDRK